MNSPILKTVSGFLMSVLMLGAVFLLLRGHNAPGGGFIAGLVISAAFALHAMANSPTEALRLLKVRPQVLMSTGLLIAIASGLPGLISGGAFLTGKWAELGIAGADAIKVGTPLLFDLGVFLLVAGVGITLTASFLEE